MKIILASASPRRKDLLKSINIKFEVIPSKKEEKICPDLSIKRLSKNLALQKTEDVFSQTVGDRMVIGSDTLICYKNKKIGKPKSKAQARQILQQLSGKWHKVASSLCVITEKSGVIKKRLIVSISKIKFIKLNNKIITEYLREDEYKDKAGAYAVQGKASAFVEKIKGCYSTIIGLPIPKLYKILKDEKLI